MRPDDDREREARSPTASAFILLAFYVALYLAVAVVVHFIHPDDDAAAQAPPAMAQGRDAVPAYDAGRGRP